MGGGAVAAGDACRVRLARARAHPSRDERPAAARCGRKRADPCPDERVVRRERLADRGIREGLGNRKRGLEQSPHVRRFYLTEYGLGPVRLAVVAAVCEQLADL